MHNIGTIHALTCWPCAWDVIGHQKGKKREENNTYKP